MFFNTDINEVSGWEMGFQLPATPVAEGIINFHHDLFFFLTAICIFVCYMLTRCIMLFRKEVNSTPLVVVHAPTLEIIWTIIPAVILVFVAIPSFSLLYSIDEIVEPLLTIKVIGHQWYWSYEFLDPNILFKLYYKNTGDEAANVDLNVTCAFDSYMVPDEDITNASQRLLAVDNMLYLPIETNIRVLVTSSDVLHCWAVPSLGVKLDACPGRLNQTSLYIKRPGTFYGQCSEICGINHAFMPIGVMGLDILGDGTKLDANTAECILPIYTTLLGTFYEK